MFLRKTSFKFLFNVSPYYSSFGPFKLKCKYIVFILRKTNCKMLPFHLRTEEDVVSGRRGGTLVRVETEDEAVNEWMKMIRSGRG